MSDEIVSLQMRLMEQDRQLDDLSKEIVRLSKVVEKLSKDCQSLRDSMAENLVKPLSEETPPPHY